VALTADGLCVAEMAGRLRTRDRAVDWLRVELANGPRPAAAVYAAAAAAGIPDRTLERAKEMLPAKSHRVHDFEAGRSEWYWYDPTVGLPKGEPFEKPNGYELPPHLAGF